MWSVLQKLRETAPVTLPEALKSEEDEDGTINIHAKKEAPPSKLVKSEEGTSSSGPLDEYLTASMGVPTQLFPGTTTFLCIYTGYAAPNILNVMPLFSCVTKQTEIQEGDGWKGSNASNP